MENEAVIKNVVELHYKMYNQRRRDLSLYVSEGKSQIPGKTANSTCAPEKGTKIKPKDNSDGDGS
jgi:hypothetical protein